MKDPMNNRISRRNMLRRVGAGVLATGIGGLLSACAAPATSPAAPAVPAAPAATAAGATAAPAAPASGDKAKLEYWTGWGGYEFDELNKLVKEFNGQSKLGEVNMTTVFAGTEKCSRPSVPAIRPTSCRRCG